MTAFTLLETGNLLGAFKEARKAEASPGGNSYKCWFLAKIAFIAGDNAMCKRELEHARQGETGKEDFHTLESGLKGK